MPHIALLAASVRTNNNSIRVAYFFQKYLANKSGVTTDLLNLQDFNFPIFEERLAYQENPSDQVRNFADRIRQADGVLMITPEYNGSYPASLKNVLDLLYAEWYRKPIAIATVSDGSFGGSQVITALLFTLWKLRAWVVPAVFPVPHVQKAFDAAGQPTDPLVTEKRADKFMAEWWWCLEAKSRMENT